MSNDRSTRLLMLRMVKEVVVLYEAILWQTGKTSRMPAESESQRKGTICEKTSHKNSEPETALDEEMMASL